MASYNSSSKAYIRFITEGMAWQEEVTLLLTQHARPRTVLQQLGRAWFLVTRPRPDWLGYYPATDINKSAENSCNLGEGNLFNGLGFDVCGVTQEQLNMNSALTRSLVQEASMAAMYFSGLRPEHTGFISRHTSTIPHRAMQSRGLRPVARRGRLPLNYKANRSTPRNLLSNDGVSFFYFVYCVNRDTNSNEPWEVAVTTTKATQRILPDDIHLTTVIERAPITQLSDDAARYQAMAELGGDYPDYM